MSKINEGFYEIGNARCIIRNKTHGDGKEMYLFYRNGRSEWMTATFDGGSLALTPLPEGVEVGNDELALAWSGSDEITDAISDIMGAMAVALGFSGNVKEAYDKGHVDGENHVLRQWWEWTAKPVVVPEGSEAYMPHDHFYRAQPPQFTYTTDSADASQV